MIYINAFILVGLISMIGQIILDNSKLTPGHITSMFVSIGALLSFLGLYDKLIEFSKIGSSIPITSFGNLLYKAALEGYYSKGIIGIFSNMLTTTSAGISASIIFAFIISMFFNSKD
ncbi:MAG: SpoVA/SpoVAEb family sporulation membrane protein [Bacilli bacterium]|nr:SpoVA/SpoVAEb family sporulation membrane protein [Bacilli bacterium]